MDDLLSRGALTTDGSGSPGREADVVVAGGPIVAVGRGALVLHVA